MRFWEIDFLRGIAILLMVFFHFFFDLKFLGLLYFESQVFWWLFPRAIATIFVFLVGLSLSISYSRVKNRPGKEIMKKYVLRGLEIFSWGLVITGVTWFLVGEGFIFFGILHLIGFSIAISYPFLRNPKYNLFLGMALILIGGYLLEFRFAFPHLMWLGFIQQGAYALDYFPVLPWFGLVLIGIYYGNVLYPKGKRSFSLKESRNVVTGFLGFLGRNSLKIYLIHQPVILTFLYILLNP